MNTDISISLCGDLLLSQRLSAEPYAGYLELREFLRRHECRFGNLESTYHNMEGCPAAFPGGHYCMAKPECLDDLRDMGFNLVSTANNHAMDYESGGLLATLRHLDERGILHAGTGENLAAASRAAFFECSGGRVAMLALTSSFHDSYAAGPQNSEMQGRPGVAPLRHKAVYELQEGHYRAIAEIAGICHVNAYHDRGRSNGFLPEVPNVHFGSYEFCKGDENRVHTTPKAEDMERTEAVIRDAKYFGDIVMVSLHTHQFAGTDATTPTEFARTFCHRCIDAGADIIVCTGSHVPRGVEQYGRGIIFHGLADFIFQNDEFDYLPEEFYTRFKTARANVTGVGAIGDIMTKGWTRGLSVNPYAWKSVMVSLQCGKDKIEATLKPIEILFRGAPKGLKGLPVISKDSSILHHIQELSTPWGTRLEIDDTDCSARLTVPRS